MLTSHHLLSLLTLIHSLTCYNSCMINWFPFYRPPLLTGVKALDLFVLLLSLWSSWLNLQCWMEGKPDRNDVPWLCFQTLYGHWNDIAMKVHNANWKKCWPERVLPALCFVNKNTELLLLLLFVLVRLASSLHVWYCARNKSWIVLFELGDEVRSYQSQSRALYDDHGDD